MTDRYTLHHGNNLDILPTIPDNSVDAIITDPPYELGFMGKKWDATGIAYSINLWRECLRVLKPGGHLLAFGGTRTYHRMTCAIEDAGFDIRDSIHWIYGSGFPKSHNLQGEWEGWGTALKPGHEPIVLARKPLDGTVAANVLQHGTGALNINACRIGDSGGTKGSNYAKTGLFGIGGKGDITSIDGGRWPANVMFDPDAADELDQQSGITKDGTAVRRNVAGKPTSGFIGRQPDSGDIGYGGEGGASRFFYVAKPSRAERNAGLDGMPTGPRVHMGSGGRTMRNGVWVETHSEPQPRANFHPTVKPITLMRYLIRLVTPPDGTILDPFAGSGTTLAAAIIEGFYPIGIELTDDYHPIIHARCQHATTQHDTNPPTLF